MKYWRSGTGNEEELSKSEKNIIRFFLLTIGWVGFGVNIVAWLFCEMLWSGDIVKERNQKRIKEREDFLEGLLLIDPESIKGLKVEFYKNLSDEGNGVYSWNGQFLEDSEKALYLRFLIHKKGLDYKLLEPNKQSKPDNDILDEPI